MKKREKIAKNASVKNSKINASEIIIHNNAKLDGVIIKAKKVTIGAETTLTDCKLFSDGEISIGEKSEIKEQAIINSFKGISLGNRCLIDRNVFVGGMQSEESEISIGNDCVILYRAYLNPTKKISIGNNVGIGGYSQIFTHGAWQNILKGYPNKFSPIVIKDNVWIPWNVMILPGVTIGKNAIIGAGSVITKNIPDNVFAAGNPAIIKSKNIKKKEPNEKEKNKIMVEIIDSFHNYAKNFLKNPNKIEKSNHANNQHITISFKDKSQIAYAIKWDSTPKNKKTILVSFKIPEKIKSIKKTEWIELDTLESNVSSETGKNFQSFLKRFGIRIKI